MFPQSQNHLFLFIEQTEGAGRSPWRVATGVPKLELDLGI